MYGSYYSLVTVSSIAKQVSNLVTEFHAKQFKHLFVYIMQLKETVAILTILSRAVLNCRFMAV